MDDHSYVNASTKRSTLAAILLASLSLAACGGENETAARPRDAAVPAPDSAVPAPDDAGPPAPADAAQDAGENRITEIQTGTTLALLDGMVRGEVRLGSRTFIGIPYAAPPVGKLRWKAPGQVEPWPGVLDATKLGVACISRDGDSSLDYVEDCLQLNVFAPESAPKQPVPVMVWLHGGGNATGSANGGPVKGTPLFDGAALRNGAPREVVVVTLNYRVGALGFLAHPALTEEQGVSGNYGLMDQQAALRWVQQNILAFGGDPENVTLFGESAGAFDTCLQTVAHGHEGLFQRAILESGNCASRIHTLAEGEADGEAFAASVGCDGGDAAAVRACLRALPADDIQPEEPPPVPGDFLFSSKSRSVPFTLSSVNRASVLAVVDGSFLVEQPLTSLVAGRFEHMPMIIGTNAAEGAGFVQGETAIADETQYLQALSDLFDDRASSVAEQYAVAEYGSASDAAAAVATDFMFVCGARRLARAASAHSDVFVYNWNHGAEVPPFAGLGPVHGVDILWVWNLWTPFLLGESPEESALTRKVLGYWTSLAASGDPNGDGLPAWPRYDETDPELVIDLEIGTDSGRRNARCDFWDDFEQ